MTQPISEWSAYIVRVHGDGDHRALDGRQLALAKGAVQPQAHDRGRRVVAERRAAREVDLFRPRHPQADLAMPVRGDRAAGDYALRDLDYLVDQLGVHDSPNVAQPDDPGSMADCC